MKADSTNQHEASAILALPDKISQMLLGVYLLISQWNPCDATGVLTGNSLALIFLGLALGFCTAAARICDLKSPSVPIAWRMLAIVFCGWLAICEYVAISGGSNGQTALLGFWQTIAMVGVASSCLHHAADPNRLAAMIRWMIGLATGASVYALYQYLVSMPRMRAEFQEDPTPFLQLEGIENGTSSALQFSNRILSAEPMGPFNLTNSLAGFLAPWLVVAVLVAGQWLIRRQAPSSAGRHSNAKSNVGLDPLRIGMICLIVAFLGLALLFTKSRTAWIAATAGLCLVALVFRSSILRRGSNRFVLFVVLIAMVASGALGVAVWRDPLIVAEAGKSLAYRSDYWIGAARLIAKSPWFGYGSLSFQSLYPHVKTITASETPADPHNLWMEIGVDSGLPGLLIAIFVASYLVYGGVSLWRKGLHESRGVEQCHASKKMRSHSKAWISVGFIVASVSTAFMTLLFSSDVDTVVSCFLFVVVALTVGMVLRSEFWLNLVTKDAHIIGMLICAVVGLHLCFSGGWMQPGVMNTLAMAIAMIVSRQVNSVEYFTATTKRWDVVGFMGWFVACGAFVVSTYLPEIRLDQWETDMQLTNPSQIDPESMNAALDLHRRSPELADRIMAMSATRIMDSRIGTSARSVWFAVYERSRQELLDRDRNQWISNDRCVEWDLLLADFFEGRDAERSSGLLERARANAEEAIARYPSSIQLQLQSAVMEANAGNWQKASERLASVEKIEGTTPHEDRKLRWAFVRIPRAFVSVLGSFVEAERIAGSSNQVRAEPVFQRLRNLPQMTE